MSLEGLGALLAGFIEGREEKRARQRREKAEDQQMQLALNEETRRQQEELRRQAEERRRQAEHEASLEGQRFQQRLAEEQMRRAEFDRMAQETVLPYQFTSALGLPDTLTVGQLQTLSGILPSYLAHIQGQRDAEAIAQVYGINPGRTAPQAPSEAPNAPQGRVSLPWPQFTGETGGALPPWVKGVPGTAAATPAPTAPQKPAAPSSGAGKPQASVMQAAPNRTAPPVKRTAPAPQAKRTSIDPINALPPPPNWRDPRGTLPPMPVTAVRPMAPQTPPAKPAQPQPAPPVPQPSPIEQAYAQILDQNERVLADVQAAIGGIDAHVERLRAMQSDLAAAMTSGALSKDALKYIPGRISQLESQINDALERRAQLAIQAATTIQRGSDQALRQMPVQVVAGPVSGVIPYSSSAGALGTAARMYPAGVQVPGVGPAEVPWGSVGQVVSSSAQAVSRQNVADTQARASIARQQLAGQTAERVAGIRAGATVQAANIRARAARDTAAIRAAGGGSGSAAAAAEPLVRVEGNRVIVSNPSKFGLQTVESYESRTGQQVRSKGDRGAPATIKLPDGRTLIVTTPAGVGLRFKTQADPTVLQKAVGAVSATNLSAQDVTERAHKGLDVLLRKINALDPNRRLEGAVSFLRQSKFSQEDAKKILRQRTFPGSKAVQEVIEELAKRGESRASLADEMRRLAVAAGYSGKKGQDFDQFIIDGLRRNR